MIHISGYDSGGLDASECWKDVFLFHRDSFPNCCFLLATGWK